MATKDKKGGTSTMVPATLHGGGEERGLVQLPVLVGSTAIRQNDASDFISQLEGPQSQPMSMPIVTIDHKQEMFILPSGELVESIQGYPALYFQTRRYYAKAYSSGSSAPPDCWSADMVVPSPTSLEKQAKSCMECEQSQWGSARDGKSQACAAQTWIFLLNPAFGDPPIMALVSPPSSIKQWLGGKFKGGYLQQARAKAGAFQLAFTEVRLERASDTHCVCVPSLLGICTDPAEKAELAKMINFFRKPMDEAKGLTPAVKVDADEPEGGESHE